MSFEIDFSQVSESGVTPGDYEVVVDSVELKDTKSGTGQYIKMKLVTDTGQAFFHNFNIKNENQQAQNIGIGQLKKMLRVSGKELPKLNPDSLSQLFGLRFVITVQNKKSEFGEQVNITNFKPVQKPQASFL